MILHRPVGNSEVSQSERFLNKDTSIWQLRIWGVLVQKLPIVSDVTHSKTAYNKIQGSEYDLKFFAFFNFWGNFKSSGCQIWQLKEMSTLKVSKILKAEIGSSRFKEALKATFSTLITEGKHSVFQVVGSSENYKNVNCQR